MDKHLSRLLFPSVGSARGAPMGRSNVGYRDARVRLHLQRMRLVDGDYDVGGAYWGGGSASVMWVAWGWGYSDEALVVCYVRGHDREDAKESVLRHFHQATFYR